MYKLKCIKSNLFALRLDVALLRILNNKHHKKDNYQKNIKILIKLQEWQTQARAKVFVSDEAVNFLTS